MTNNHIGKFFQGQALSITITTPENATLEEKKLLADNDLYIGIYHTNKTDKMILSTANNSVVKNTDNITGNTTLVCALPATQTKNMLGHYTMEMLIKNSDNTFTSPCENVICFSIERRRISEVI